VAGPIQDYSVIYVTMVDYSR